jgi:hypothetical protein
MLYGCYVKLRTAIVIFTFLVFIRMDLAGRSIVEIREYSSVIARADMKENQKGPNIRNKTEEKGKKSVEEELVEMHREIEELKDRIADLEKAESEQNDLKLSGFFDVGASNYKNKPNVFEIGGLELELEHNYKENFQVAAALVFSDGAELDVGFIDYHLFGGEISPRGRLFKEKGLHLQVGKFDVPFGNDWQYFGAIDRISITPPLTTEEIMEGGYNDVGMRLLSNFISFNVSLYLLRGIEQGYSYGGNSYGGRLGITPFSNPYSLRVKNIPVFELGGSYIIDVDRNGSQTEKLAAADFQSKIGPLFIRSEYYRRDKTVGILLQGYHVTAGFDFYRISRLPLLIYSRYSITISERYERGDEKNTLARIAAGLNINLYNISYIKLEYLQYLEVYDEFSQDEYYTEKLYYLQLVIAF